MNRILTFSVKDCVVLNAISFRIRLNSSSTDGNSPAFVDMQVEEAERLWNACVFYAVKRLSSATSVGEGAVEGTAAGFTLMQLLQVTNVRFVSWFCCFFDYTVKLCFCDQVDMKKFVESDIILQSCALVSMFG